MEIAEQNPIDYRRIVSLSLDLICIAEMEGYFKYVNPTWEKMLGYTRDELLSRPFLDFIHPDDHAKNEEEVAKLAAGHQTIDFENRYIHKDGSIRYISWTAQPVADEKAMYCIGRDITERKQAEEALRESEEKYRKLFDTVSDGIMIFDAETREFIDANDAVPALYGYSKEEFLELKHTDITAEPEESKESIEKALSGEISRIPLRYHMRKDGTTVPVEISISTFTLRNRNVLCGVVRDITKRKQADEELKESREQLRNLSEYLQSSREQERASIAREIHDNLGQLLTALKMDIRWLDKRLLKDQGPLLNKTISMIQLIDKGVESVQRICSELKPSLLDDLGISAAIEWQIQEFTDRTGIKCKVSIDPEDIILDKERSIAFFRVIQETLTNVARHANATEIYISFNEKAGDLVLKVKDNGKGITAEEISHPQSFGLMGIRERAHSSGGKAKIEGIPGKGTTVTVRIPIEK